MSLKEQLLKAGMTKEQIDNHESDLYVLKNAISTEVLKNYEFKQNVTTFISQIDKKVWYDIPFGYMSEHYNQKFGGKIK